MDVRPDRQGIRTERGDMTSKPGSPAGSGSREPLLISHMVGISFFLLPLGASLVGRTNGMFSAMALE